MEQIIQKCSAKWFAVVGDNGFGYTSSDAEIVESLRKLHRVTVFELPNQDFARYYAYNAYAARWFMRNTCFGKSIELPVNLPPDYIFVDQDFEQREGGRTVPYFPALLN